MSTAADAAAGAAAEAAAEEDGLDELDENAAVSRVASATFLPFFLGVGSVRSCGDLLELGSAKHQPSSLLRFEGSGNRNLFLSARRVDVPLK